MKNKINKRGQESVGMSFGMIFAIFLIVVFVIIAFIAVNFFLDFGKKAGIGEFYVDLQDTVNNAIQSQSSDSKFAINLPSNIERVCFANLSADTTDGLDYEAIKDYDIYDANVFLLPPEKAQDMERNKIDRINITKITENSNPYCVDADSDLKIVKEFFDRLVWIE